jgi:NADH-quinone oxidoreductase subunit M
MGFVTLGIFAFNQQALQGATMVMFAHGLNTAALFLLVGVVYDRAHTRLISAFSGLSTSMPIYASILGVFVFASIGLPGMTGFVGEFHSLIGTFRGAGTTPKVTAIVSTTVVIFAAWYMLWLFQRVAQGTVTSHAAGGHDAHNGHGAPDGRAPARAGAAQAAHAARAAGGHATEKLDPEAGRPGIDPHFTHEEPAVGEEEHGHADPHAVDPYTAEREAQRIQGWGDINRRELVTLVPLLALTILFGVYPGPIFHLLAPALANLLRPFDGGASAAMLGQ